MTIESTRLQPTPGATRIGQATAVEQSRAVAEVLAAVQVAQAYPRDPGRARQEMQRSCTQQKFAEHAFYSYQRGGKPVTGPSAQFARELMRCWGNMQAGVAELRRDDEHGQSEMQAWCWDVETNARNSITFVVPHASYMTGKALDGLRDIYENNANQGARRVREMILALLPAWFVEEGEQLAHATLERGDGTPLPVRRKKAVDALGTLGIDVERVVRKLGRKVENWTPQDLARLTVAYQSIKRGELAASEEFPEATVSMADLGDPTPPPPAVQRPAPVRAVSTADVGPAPDPAPPADVPPEGPPETGTQDDTADDEPVSDRGWRDVGTMFVKAGVTGPRQTERRNLIMSRMLGRKILGRLNLTDGDARLIVASLDHDPRGECARILSGEYRGDETPATVIPPGHAEDPVSGQVVDVQHDEYPPADDDDDDRTDPYTRLDPTVEPAWKGQQDPGSGS